MSLANWSLVKRSLVGWSLVFRLSVFGKKVVRILIFGKKGLWWVGLSSLGCPSFMKRVFMILVFSSRFLVFSHFINILRITYKFVICQLKLTIERFQKIGSLEGRY